jgi:hypothetical protein
MASVQRILTGLKQGPKSSGALCTAESLQREAKDFM